MEYVYLVNVCNYEDVITVGYFTNYDQAKAYCDLHNNDNEYYNDMKYYVKKIDVIFANIPPSKLII